MTGAAIRVFYSRRPGGEFGWELLVPGEHADTEVAAGRAQTVDQAFADGRAKAAELGLEVAA